MIISSAKLRPELNKSDEKPTNEQEDNMKLPFASVLANILDNFFNTFCRLFIQKYPPRLPNPGMTGEDEIYVSCHVDRNNAPGRILFHGKMIICLQVSQKAYNV